jgi:protein mago nashi
MTAEGDIYLRYYVGHKGRFGHEFIEFELRPDGHLRYANNSNYKHDTIIRRELRVGRLVREQVLLLVKEAGLVSHTDGSAVALNDEKWPLPNRDGRQELEVICSGEHVYLSTCKIGSLLDIQSAGNPEGLQTFHFMVQDLKTLVLSLVSAHYKIKPI